MSEVFKEQANVYDEWFVENDKLYLSELNAVKSVLDKDKAYVEVGVGTGLFASKLGIKRGVEPCDEMAVFARERGVEVEHATAEALPYSDSSIEGIVMITVDCFIKDIMPVFNEAMRVLKAGGSYVMAFLDRETPLGAEYEASKATNDFYRDATFRSTAEMIGYLEKAGFVIEDSIETIYTLENKMQDYKRSAGNGVFHIIKAKKEIE